MSFAIAVDELSATPARSTALALIVAAATMAIVSIGGAKLDLERGIDRLTGAYFGSSDLWVVPRDSSNVFVTRKFDPQDLIARLGREPGIREASASGWTFLDFAKRRVLVISPASSNRNVLVPSQVIQGDAGEAARRIRTGGWVALSSAVAKERDANPGDVVELPTPTGIARLRLAAVTANHGWPSGSLVINERDYRKLWHSDEISAVGVNLDPGVGAAEGKRIVTGALNSNRALTVRTGEEMVNDRSSAFAQGLSRLRQISFLVLGASVLAVIAAMFAAVWQRRSRLASLRSIGMYKGELYRTLLSETCLIVILGCLAGIAFGLVGQYFASRWTTTITGYMAPYNPAIGLGLFTLLRIVLLSAIATLGPAVLVSRLISNRRDYAI